MTTLASRSPAEIAFQCRVNRIVDWWITQKMKHPTWAWNKPSAWHPSEWKYVSKQAGQRRDDPPPDAALRAAVCAEIDAIQDRLDRRERDEREGSDA